LEIWSRALSDGSVAVVLFNRNTDEPEEIKADFALVCINFIAEYLNLHASPGHDQQH